jgi:hypothetical protein
VAAKGKQPAVRAISVHDILDFLDTYEPGSSQRVRALIPDDVLAVIASTPRRGWIELEDDIYVPTAIWSTFGDEDAREMMSEFLKSHFESPLLGPLIKSTRKLFGLTPVNLLRMVPSGWRLVYRDYCGIEFRVTGNDSGELILTDVITEIIDSAAYLGSFRAIFKAAIDLTDHAGEVSIQRVERTARRVVYPCRWWPASA